MPRDKGDAAFLLDMLEAATTVSEYIVGKSREDYRRDQMLRDAVERRVSIIGEAARGVSKAFRDAHSEIPWQPIMRTRNIIVHDYDDVNPEVLWRIATVHVPELIRLLTPLIPPLPPEANG